MTTAHLSEFHMKAAVFEKSTLGVAYRVASTNSESPYRQRGVVLPHDPWDAVTDYQDGTSHDGLPCALVEVPMLPPDDYGCGGTRFTLAAVEEHERGCRFWTSLSPSTTRIVL